MTAHPVLRGDAKNAGPARAGRRTEHLHLSLRPRRCLSLLVLAGLALLCATSLTAALATQPLPSTLKRSSSAIAITPDGKTLLVVNPDSNSLTLVDTASRAVLTELPVGVDPRSVSVAPDGAWACVANQGSDSVSVVDVAARAVVATIAVGFRPVGVAVSPDGRYVAVAELGDDQVRWLRSSDWRTLSVVPVPDRPCGLAFTPDGRRLLVTHLLSGEVSVLGVEGFSVYLPIVLKRALPLTPALSPELMGRGGAQSLPSPSPLMPFAPQGRRPLTGGEPRQNAPRRFAGAGVRGVISTWPNVAPAPAVVINSSGTRAYLPQTMAHGQGLNTQFDTTVFAKVSVLNLQTDAHQTSEHISLPETDTPVGLPYDVALARDDRELWVVNAASNDVSVLDISVPISTQGIETAESTLAAARRSAHIAVGDNPRGIVIAPDGSAAYVNNTLAGTVSVIDTRAYTVTAVITTTRIPLPPVLLNGKRLFFSSARPELSRARWISCNTCHIEGEQDGRTWLLQYTGEVPPGVLSAVSTPLVEAGAQAIITRNTTSLLGMIETYPLRWSGEWNESADSEFSIRFEQFGAGLIAGEMNPTLGPPNQGRSYDLDCLASYIDSLQALPPRRGGASAVNGTNTVNGSKRINGYIPAPGDYPLVGSPSVDSTNTVNRSKRIDGYTAASEGYPLIRLTSVDSAVDRGRVLFNSARTQCSVCHPAPLYTDLRKHDVGTASSYGEWFGPSIDTPTLRCVYDSAPYLHDGSAATLLDVLTTRNPADQHGNTSGLTAQELDDLVAFMLALPEPETVEGFRYEVGPCHEVGAQGAGGIRIGVEGRDVWMAHDDARYNCCARVAVFLEGERPLLKFVEQETYLDTQPCRCLCNYDLTARATNLPPGTYHVEVWNGGTQELLAEAAVTVPEQ